jgi:hypothetical protein
MDKNIYYKTFSLVMPVAASRIMFTTSLNGASSSL